MSTISDRAYEIESDPTLTASSRAILSIFEALRTEFAAGGCPLTPDQEAFIATIEAAVQVGATNIYGGAS